MSNNGNNLGIVPVTRENNHNSSDGLTPYDANQPLTPQQQRTVNEFREQMLVIAGAAHKAHFGMTKIAEIHEYAEVLFVEGVGSILEIKTQAQGTEYQLYVNEFTKHIVQRLAGHTIAAVDTASKHIEGEMDRPLYSSPDPPKRGGVLGWLGF